MEPANIEEAAKALYEARQTHKPLTALSADCQPQTIVDGHAVQDALISLLGEPVAGWKVGGLKPGEVMRGAVLASRLHKSPARIKASDMPLLGVESEIAFRFDRTLPPREEAYSYEEVAEAVTALPTIEVVDTRFASYRETPVLHRLGDCMSNGALIYGEARPDWRDFDLATLPVTQKENGAVAVESVGGNVAGDPLLPAVALVNLLQADRGVTEGQIVTTGTYTGLRFMKPGTTIHTEFAGFGTIELHLEA